MKITVDLELCQGHAQCEAVAPEVFRVNDDGLVELLDDAPPESARGQVEEAVRLCPADAIRLAEA